MDLCAISAKPTNGVKASSDFQSNSDLADAGRQAKEIARYNIEVDCAGSGRVLCITCAKNL